MTANVIDNNKNDTMLVKKANVSHLECQEMAFPLFGRHQKENQKSGWVSYAHLVQMLLTFSHSPSRPHYESVIALFAWELFTQPIQYIASINIFSISLWNFVL
ncbi:hypothetical protein BLOT_013067 [Blomia tropicalis]|nr:hypothetical protein BLOT_013067 [Blomia tropicalis]